VLPALLVSTLTAPELNVVVPVTLIAPSLVPAPTVLFNTAFPTTDSASVPAAVAFTVLSNVTVVPVNALDDVLAAGRAREAKEAGFFDALRKGTTTVELLGLDTSPVTRD